MEARLPAHLEVSGLLRAVAAAGGFATVIAKGERDAGTLLITCCEHGKNYRAYERMPRPEGGRAWTLTRTQDPENPEEFVAYLERRGRLRLVGGERNGAHGLAQLGLASDLPS